MNFFKPLDLELTPDVKLFSEVKHENCEVSEQYGLSVDTLRYYERVGLIPPVNRSKNGIRDYNELDLRRVDFIKCTRNAGLPVEVLIEYMGLNALLKKEREIVQTEELELI